MQIKRSFESLSSRQTILILTVVFGVVHFAYWLVGVRMDMSLIEYVWNYLDIDQLKNNLLQSVWYLNSQPPLFNLFLGLIFKFFPGLENLLIQTTFILFAWLFSVSVLKLLRIFGISNLWAMILSTLFLASPSFVLNEHLLGYDFPLAAILSVSTLFLMRYLKESKWRDGFLFFLCLGIMCGTRSLFHITYFGLALTLLMLLRSREWKVILTAAFVPFVFVLGINLKTLVLFHQFTTSTLMGMNVAKVLTRSVDLQTRQHWFQKGIVSEVILHEPGSPLDSYPPEFQKVTGFEGIAVLHSPKKRDGVSNNLNHLAYIKISNQYLRDALSVIANHPEAELFGVMSAWYCYFRSPNEDILFEPNRSKIFPVVQLYDYAFFGKLPWQVPYGKGYNLYVFLLIGLPLLFFFGLRVVFPGEHTKVKLDQNQKTLLLFMMLNVIYIAFITNLMELAENQRGQFYGHAFFLVLFGVYAKFYVVPRLQIAFGARIFKEPDSKVLNLRVGEVVEVRNWDEILETLDEQGTFENLPVMPEMKKFCGHRFSVFKRADRICVEGYKYRRLSNAVIFKNVDCSGDDHDGCKRSCPLLWKEAWLQRVTAEAKEASVLSVDSRNGSLRTRSGDAERFFCQSTELHKATSHLSVLGNIETYVRDIIYGNLTLRAVVKALSISLLRNTTSRSWKSECGDLVGKLTKTPSETVGLQPGDVVEIKTPDEIARTLDAQARNRGLLFAAEMVQYSGKKYIVKEQVDKMIDEQSGMMRTVKSSVTLQNLTCGGMCNRGCARNVYPMWREAWLRKVK